jgi:hypothetical protein
MELITALIVAGPLGYLCRTRRQGLLAYLLVWVVVFPVQTIVVLNEGGTDDDPIIFYFLVNAGILAVGIGLNTLGARLRARRRQAGAA